MRRHENIDAKVYPGAGRRSRGRLERPDRRWVPPAVLAAMLIAGPASAASITIADAAFVAPMSGVHDNFSDFATCGQSGALSTSVGTFDAGGRAGGGESVCGNPRSEQVRAGENYGRDGAAYVDSNDTALLRWTLPGDTRSARFRLRDVADRPGTDEFRLRVGGLVRAIGRQGDGAVNYVTVLFDDNDARVVEMHMVRPGELHYDGYGIDGVTIAPVPLPAPVLLLVGALGALTFVKRSKQT